MPVVSVSLSDMGYEGYANLPKGSRSRVIDKLLRDYALKSNFTVHHGEHMSVQQVFERQKYLEMTIETFGQTIKDLKKELKK